jgi:hypothetical protein
MRLRATIKFTRLKSTNIHKFSEKVSDLARCIIMSRSDGLRLLPTGEKANHGIKLWYYSHHNTE